MQDSCRWRKRHTPIERLRIEMKCCGSLFPASRGDVREEQFLMDSDCKCWWCEWAKLQVSSWSGYGENAWRRHVPFEQKCRLDGSWFAKILKLHLSLWRIVVAGIEIFLQCNDKVWNAFERSKQFFRKNSDFSWYFLWLEHESSLTAT